MVLTGQGILLIAAAVLVGVLHTMVPDHWAPIALLSRQHGWSKAQTARTAALAGVGHTVSTLVIAVLVWAAGSLLAKRFGDALSIASSIALIAFGAWIAIGSWREIARGHDDGHSHFGHAHLHRHESGLEHRHWHEHHEADWHAIEAGVALAPVHGHEHRTTSRTALLLILGSSPMVEGIPAFFAAGRYGMGLLAVMSALFAASTVLTYVVLCVASSSGIQRLDLGRFEQYGEVISGSFIALVGLVFFAFPNL